MDRRTDPYYRNDSLLKLAISPQMSIGSVIKGERRDAKNHLVNLMCSILELEKSIGLVNIVILSFKNLVDYKIKRVFFVFSRVFSYLI